MESATKDRAANLVQHPGPCWRVVPFFEQCIGERRISAGKCPSWVFLLSSSIAVAWNRSALVMAMT
jgi:hypothetical protein